MTSPHDPQPPADKPVTQNLSDQDPEELRRKWDAELRAEKGDAWMEANRERLDREWEYILATIL